MSPVSLHRLFRILMVLMVLWAFLPAAAARAIPVPPDIKKSVVFLFLPNADGKLIPSGTGFLMGVRHPVKKGIVYVYLVTAKHVLQTADRSAFVPQAYVRLNTKDGRSDVLTISLQADGSKKNVYVHPDPTVDLAVIPVFEDPARYDFKVVSEDLLTTQPEAERLEIREGTDVFYAGLFVPHLGVLRNYPIVRFGKVALLPEEKINWGGKEAELYLIESASFGGNSGAPVFFVLPAAGGRAGAGSGGASVKLAGVLVGYFGEVEPVGPSASGTRTLAMFNTGVSAAVPAFKLREILFGEELKKQRSG
ncbi:MAG: trypsin-like peptidase domain-containing protein [Nitrospirae bacterium]|nr:trypsin-like peptidase domain-containing protein [Nitrospirota bacterium]